MALPDDLDHDKLAGAALAILSLTTFHSGHAARVEEPRLGRPRPAVPARVDWRPGGQGQVRGADRGRRASGARAAGALLRQVAALNSMAIASSSRRAW